MIARKHQIIRVRISEVEARFVARMGERAALGGSRFRHEKGTMTPETNLRDQIKALSGEFALSKYLTGSARDFMLWRWIRNQNPRVGDGGSDLPGLNIDIKTTVASPGRPLGRYILSVLPKDHHEGWVYVLGIAAQDYRSVALVGWAPTSALPDRVETSGTFEGSYILPATELSPLPPFKWWK